MKKLGIIIVCCLSILGCTKEKPEIVINKLTAKQVYQEYQTQEGVLIFDVRSKQEFEQGHILNALNFPVEEIEKESVKIYNKKVKVIVYCRSGSRSNEAALKLKELGFENIYDMGGLQDWSYGLVQVTNNYEN